MGTQPGSHRAAVNFANACRVMAAEAGGFRRHNGYYVPFAARSADTPVPMTCGGGGSGGSCVHETMRHNNGGRRGT